MITRHFTATGFIVKGDKTLLLMHKKLQMWLPPGGHIEENELPHEAFLREVKEETGLDVKIVPGEISSMGDVLVLPQPRHILLEKIKEDHEHIDIIYFAHVTGGELLDEHENDELKWFDLSDLPGDLHTDVETLAKEALLELSN